MPTYAYRCFDCGHEFEVFQKITDDPVKVCESCSGDNVKRLLFASPFQLKGTGWYQTDYGKSSSSSTTHSTSTSPSDSASSTAKESKADSSTTAATSTSSTPSATAH